MTHQPVDWTKPLRRKGDKVAVTNLRPSKYPRTVDDVNGKASWTYTEDGRYSVTNDDSPYDLENYTPDIAPHTAELAEVLAEARAVGYQGDTAKGAVTWMAARIARLELRSDGYEKLAAPEARELLRLSSEAAKVPGLEAKVAMLRKAIAESRYRHCTCKDCKKLMAALAATEAEEG